jgi:hypothetical protein
MKSPKFQKILYNALSVQSKRATIMKKILLVLAFLSLPAFGAAQDAQGAKEASRPAAPPPSSTQTAQVSQNGGINTPFANAEESFYQKAWPIKKSHAAFALILMGGVLLSLLTFLIRKMAQSGPRKPSAS